MQFKSFLNFVDKEDQRLCEKYGNYSDEEKKILARTVKINEEVGELSDEVLKYCSLAREEKLQTKNLEDEFADVLLTVFLLAKSMKVDIPKALEKKIKKIEKRYK